MHLFVAIFYKCAAIIQERFLYARVPYLNICSKVQPLVDQFSIDIRN